jgi:hypothetical protein
MRRIINMKDYKMINEAITTAEDLLKTTKQHYEDCICNREWDIKFQICDYIYNQLSNAGFPEINKIKCEVIHPPIESYEISFHSASYLCDGINFQYQLFIHDYMNGKISRIYFNQEDYYESTTQSMNESTLIALIKEWGKLKAKLTPAIDNAYQQRINRIKKEAEEIKRKEEILKGFKL